MPFRVKVTSIAVLLGLLAGCSQAGSPPISPESSTFISSVEAIEAAAIAATASRTQSSSTDTRIPGPTTTPLPSDTVLPSSTPWPSGFTPTLRPLPTRGLPPTATLSPRETCPEPTRESAPVEFLEDPAAYEESLLAFLAANGNIREYKQKLDEDATAPHFQIESSVFEDDITGDGNSEFLISIHIRNRTAFYFLGCIGGRYGALYRSIVEDAGNATLHFGRLESVSDINGDGIKEVVYSFVTLGGNRGEYLSAQVLGWNGRSFRTLIPDGSQSDPFFERNAVDEYVGFRDVDGNGTVELIFRTGVGGIDCEGGVEREAFSVWMWDWEYYRYMWREHAAPLYRFQAAYDGDFFSSLGMLDRAEISYLRAVFDETLAPGSTAEWKKEGSCPLDPGEKPDPTEPTRIKAYARFRLVELYVALGRVLEGESHRSSMRAENPLGTPGYIYAYLANTFWWEYAKEGEDISAGCAAVRREAEKSPRDVFGLFENYGTLNPGPTLDTICPFST